ncbi:MAG: histidine kinase dimerization/phospho-acceptor domain-containing protein [Candidatus Planktophila sp.]|jgi:two-component system, OmpR family, sensor kinase|tara:strand:- start:713 stop:1924 length:1212 start_codon:yes stop_codon:yes gene_type:complete
MFKSGSRFAALSILVITLLSSVIGGFATVDARNSELDQIDQSINLVIQRVNTFPLEAISAAILSVQEENLDVTLSLVTKEGVETVINEFNTNYQGVDSLETVNLSLKSAIGIKAGNEFRIRSIRILGGDYLVVAADLTDLNENFRSNLKNLGVFTVVADALAIFLSIYLLRRHNRGLDQKGLERMQKFLGDASHELRTPLTVIKGYNEMLSKHQLSDSADRDRAFTRIGSEIKRMENLIHDLLLLAELGESRPTTFEEIDFVEVLEAHIKDFALLNTDRTVAISLIEPCILQGSREHLNRLIQNCFSNIVRHTPANAPVSITLKMKGKRLNLVIEDGGPGLPESAYGSGITAMQRFDPSRSRDSGGSGLGMSIIAAIIQEHGGELELHKSDLGGLAIAIELPR